MTRALARSLVLLWLAAGCATYREATLASIEVGDEVVVTDPAGTRISFQVTAVGPEGISGDRIRIGAGQVLLIERREISVAPVGEALGDALQMAFGLIYIAGSTFPIWAVFVL